MLGLGRVLDTLIDNSFAWWVRFEVRVVRRDDGSRRRCGNESPYEDPDDFNFRFTPDFDLDVFHQIWFFGDFPMNDPDDPDDPKYSPLRDDELKVLAEWMDRGGGVLPRATTGILGVDVLADPARPDDAEVDGRPGRPAAARTHTPRDDAGPPRVVTGHEHEEDTVPQPIEPVYRPTATSIAIRNYVPHPLLCAATA